MRAETTCPSLWKGQVLHFACLAGLLVVLWFVWRGLHQPFPVAFWIAAAIPVVHQVFVWLAWRLELQSAALSKTVSFQGYLAIFLVLFGGRFVSLIALGWLDRGSLGLDLLPRVLLTTLLGGLGVYAIYSVQRYFGIARASGADHFEVRYRDMPLVNQGIFRWTNNGMYLFAFLLFWAIAIGFNASAALAVTGFSHIYIWVHFYATEKPDMEYLYHS